MTKTYRSKDLRRDAPGSAQARAEALIHELAWWAVLQAPSPSELDYRQRHGKSRYKGTPGGFIQRLSSEKRELLKHLRSEDLAVPTRLASLIGK